MRPEFPVLPPVPVLTRAEVREIDVRALKEFGIPGLVLMENAGRNAAELLRTLGIAGPVLIIAGKGNNGGDGMVMLRHLKNAGVEARMLLAVDPRELTGDAAVNYGVLQAAGWEGDVWGKTLREGELEAWLRGANWIVDALLGTGSRGSPREPYATLIRAINASGTRVLAVDIPTGLDCDTGTAVEPCIRAAQTMTFVASKVGFQNPAAGEYLGEVHVIDIGIPQVMLDPQFRARERR